MADLGFGVLVKRGDGATTEVFTAIAELTGLSGPGFSIDMIDATHTESADAFREFIAGLGDAGELGLDLHFLPANATQDESATGTLGDLIGRGKHNYQIVWPDTAATTWNLTGLVSGFEPAATIEDKMTLSVTIKISGLPTFS